MVDIEKLKIAKAWIEKLANGINPLNNESVKEDDLVNNVHISRCLFYVAEVLGDIKVKAPVERKSLKAFFLSSKDAANIPLTTANGLADFVRLVNAYIQADMRPLSIVQVLKWLRNEGILQEVVKEDGHKTNLPTDNGKRMGITTEVKKNAEGLDYQRVLYSVEVQRFMLNNIESIAMFH